MTTTNAVPFTVWTRSWSAGSTIIAATSRSEKAIQASATTAYSPAIAGAPVGMRPPPAREQGAVVASGRSSGPRDGTARVHPHRLPPGPRGVTRLGGGREPLRCAAALVWTPGRAHLGPRVG